MADSIRADQAATPVSAGDATKTEHYNNALDDVEMALTEFDKGSASAIAAISTPAQAQAIVDTTNDLLYVCLDGTDFVQIAPSSWVFGGGFVLGVNGTTYVGLGQSGAGYAPLAAQAIMPFDCLVKNLYLSCLAVATGTLTATVNIEGVDTSITCAATSSATSASDTTNTDTVSAGERLVIKMVGSGGNPLNIQGVLTLEVQPMRTV